MKKIFLCGLTLGGKGRLRPLLDGHKNIITGPFQNIGFGVLAKDFDNFLIKNKNRTSSIVHKKIKKETESYYFFYKNDKEIFQLSIADFLIFLHKSSSGFNEILHYNFAKKIRAASSGENQVFVDFNFNYYNFIEDIKNNILLKKTLNKEEIFDIILESFVTNWKNVNNQLSDSTFITLPSPNRLNTIYRILESISEPKIVIVNRKPEGRCFASAKHSHYKNMSESKIFNMNSLYTNNLLTKFDRFLYSLNFINEMKLFNKAIYDLQKKHPSKVIVINFEDLFENLVPTMKNLCKFLNLEDSNKLYTPSLNSVSLTNKENGLENQIRDNPIKYLSKVQISFIKFLFGDKNLKINILQTIIFYILYSILYSKALFKTILYNLLHKK